MKLSDEQKAENARQRQIHECMKSKPKYQAKVAKEMQRMIRAEDAANTDQRRMAVIDGHLSVVAHRVGYCVCITCGRVCPWSGGRGVERLNCGHFLAGRGSILFEEDCVAPQCAECNMHHGGRPLEFRKWMEAVRGIETIDRLERLKRQSISFDRDTLVDMRIGFSKRLKAAELKMKGTT